MIRDDLVAAVDSMLSDDPREALAACRFFETEQLPWLRQRAVARARLDGWSWARIGRLLGCSAQALHARYRTIVPRPVPRPAEWGEDSMEAGLAALERWRSEDRSRDVVDPVPW